MAKKKRTQASKPAAAPTRAAKSDSSCGSCGPWAWVWLVLGLALLARDLGWFNLLGSADWAGLVLTLLGVQWVASQ